MPNGPVTRENIEQVRFKWPLWRRGRTYNHEVRTDENG